MDLRVRIPLSGQANLLSVTASLWKQLLLPQLACEPHASVEGQFFLEALQITNPTLLEEAKRSVEEHRDNQSIYEAARVALLSTARRLFVRDNEEHLLRPIALVLGLLPSLRSSVLDLSADAAKHCVQDPHGPVISSWLEPVQYWSDTNERFQISSTQEACPENVPLHKYTALFDPRPCFDLLRMSFMNEAGSNLNIFLYKKRKPRNQPINTYAYKRKLNNETNNDRYIYIYEYK